MLAAGKRFGPICVTIDGKVGARSTNPITVADVQLKEDRIEVNLSLLDRLLAFSGSLSIPLSHITNAYVSNFEDLELQFRLSGINVGLARQAGLFAGPEGVIFCDLAGASDCLVIETRGERFPRIAVTLDKAADPNALAHEIMRRIPDSGPDA